MEVQETPPAQHEEAIELVLRRCPGINRTLIEPPVKDAGATASRVMLSAVDAERVIGFAVQFHGASLPPGVFLEIVAVDQDHVDAGLGGRLHRALADRLPESAASVVGQVDDTDQRSLAVVHRWGFSTVQHSITSRLELASASAPPLPDGVTVEVNPRLDFTDEPAVEAMFDASQTNPERDYEGPSTLANLRGHATDDGGGRSVAVVLRDHGRPVALSYALVRGDLAQLVYTGVEPAQRGRGLGALAKQSLHHEAAQAGATYALTDNEEHNTGIRHVNEGLGYRKVGGSFWVRRPCAASDQLQPEVEPQPSQT